MRDASERSPQVTVGWKKWNNDVKRTPLIQKGTEREIKTETDVILNAPKPTAVSVMN